MNNSGKKLLFVLLGVFGLFGTAFAGDEVGRIVALRGSATIERGKSILEAKLKGDIMAQDTVKTGAASRVKLLFIDDSVLTLAENSKLVVKEFIYSKGKEGKSIFNLLDGKMRSVVGRTKFEVQTPTVVASARGTIIFFEVGILDNMEYTKVIDLEGIVDIRSLLPNDTSLVSLTPGNMIIVKQGEPLSAPVKAPQSELDKARSASSNKGAAGVSPQAVIAASPVVVPPLPQQQPVAKPVVTTSPVNVNINFPAK